MATYRAIHPFVREAAFRHGFKPVNGDDYRVEHSVLRGKASQIRFYKAFTEAASMPGVRRVASVLAKSGRTYLFPEVPESRWEAARRGIPWCIPREVHIPAVQPNNTVPKQGTVGDLIREKLAEKLAERKVVTPRSVLFNGEVSETGSLTSLNVSTTDDATARALLQALRLNTCQ